MQTRPLGNSDIHVSVITMGCWSIAGDFTWGPQDRADGIDAIRASLDAGIISFDTAPGYGDGLSEQLLGEALGPQRDKVVILDKVSQDKLAPADLKASVDKSLSDLGTDWIDVLQIHWPNWDIPFADTFGAMRELRHAGKIRAIAVSNFGPRDLSDALAIEPAIVCNQLGYSLLSRQLEYELQPICVEHGVSIVCYSPLAQGLLTGKFHDADEVPATRARTRHFDSRRRPHTRHGEPGCESQTFQALRALHRLAGEHHLSMSDMALAWLLAQPAVACVLPGARNRQQALRNAQAANCTLSKALIDQLNQLTDPVKQALGHRIDLWTSEADSRMR